MARLRKPSPEGAVFIPPPASPFSRSTRSSPRKTLRESPSKRELRYTSSQDNKDSFLIPKAPASETPKKQRVLRPVASNSKLFRKLSDESLTSPERKPRRSDKSDILGFSYSKTLARTLARRGSHVKRIGESQAFEPETVTNENDEPIESTWCEDRSTTVTRKEKEIRIHKDEEEDDEDPVVDVRHPRRQLQVKAVQIKTAAGFLEDLTQSAEETTKSEMPPPALAPIKLPFRKGHSTIASWAQEVVDLTSSPNPKDSMIAEDRARSASLTQSSRPTSSSSTFDAEAVVKFSPTPTKQRSPRKAPPISRPSTPPLPPSSPTKLKSPSKKHRIPEAPSLRESIDAFWQADVVNDWNDQHSPRKQLFSPRKQKLWQALERQEKDIFSSDSDSEDSLPSPTTSPRKKNQSRSQSPMKNDSALSPTVAQIRAQRKAFSANKHALAESFLAELDQKITDGEIVRLSASTGGIKLIWSKTLKTTAGRANWRRESLRLRTGPSPTGVKPEVRHHCSIELAEKVIDDEERLYNVLAHEYCHLTTFMISNIRTNPHGKEFRAWASKVSEAFADRNVVVTTKHSYAIEYKYVWECINCSYEFKRHSKSVDPARHSCGKCQGRLVQTKPVPRGGKTPGKAREKSEYQVFVKENFARVKAKLESEGKDAQMGRVMEAVAKEYRERKEPGNSKASAIELDGDDGELELVFEKLDIKDDDV